MTLNDLKPGQSGKISFIRARGRLKRRFMDMGIVAGTDVTVQKIAPLGDPIEISVRQYRLSLRKDEADSIEMEVEP